MRKIADTIHHFFIPREDNNYRSKALHLDFLSVYLLIAVILTFTFKSFSSPLHNVLGFATDITVDKLYSLTNAQRQSNGLSTLNYNEKLAQAAAGKAQDMFNKNYWAHYGPNGETPWNFILGAGYQYEYAGENLAKNFLFSDGVVDAWMNSPTHRDNMLRREYTDVGFAVVNGMLNGEETTLVVQMFGTPLNSPVVTQNNNPIQIDVAPTTIPDANEEIVQNDEKEVKAKAPLNIPVQTVLAQEKSVQKPSIQKTTYNMNIVFLSFILLVLCLDLYFSVKMKIVRVSGKNIAHIIFILFIIGGLLLIAKGAILQGITI